MRKPNIIYIYADDLGRGMLSCYGQQKFVTHNIDKLATDGMRFTHFYATAFCAPARASLMCGIHDAHSGSWTYTPGAYYKKLSTGELTFDELQEILQNTGIEAKAGDEFIGTVAQKAGYVTAEIGKLEWGFSTTAESVKSHGWDYHFGYYDHIRCHGFYPPFLFENGDMVTIEGNTDPHCGRPSYLDEVNASYPEKITRDMTGRAVYSQDLFDEKSIKFIRENKDKPFFLFHSSQLPHGPIFYPTHHEQVKDRDDLTDIEKEYASMVLRLDETVGKLVKEIDDLGLTNDTIFLFASDNGHTPNYQQMGRSHKSFDLNGRPTNNKDYPFRTETCGDVFNGNDSMAGLKFSNWDGGCKIPFIAKWPGHIPSGSTCNKLFNNYDTMATIADIGGLVKPSRTDGISYLSALFGQESAVCHDYVVFSCTCGPALVTKEGWKLRVYMSSEVLSEVSKANLSTDDRVEFQLYNLKEDYSEKHDLSETYPDIVKKLKTILIKECDGNLYNGTPMAHHACPNYPVPAWNQIVKDII